jgi:hypothetical protein
LQIVTGWGKTGNVDEFAQNLAFNRLLLISSNGSAGAQEVFHLFGVEEPILSDRWTLLGSHAPVGHGSVWTDSHTMAALYTEFIRIFSGDGDRSIVLYFNDSRGALSDTQTVLLAFLLICNK